MNITDIEQEMRNRAPQFRALNARARFVLDGTEVILLDATTTPVKVERKDGEAACTIRMSQANMEKLLAGKLDPVLAFTLGRLKVEGSKGLAMKLAALIEA